MISNSEADGEHIIIVQPNHSSTWRANLWVLLGLSVPSLGAAIGFTLMGAWPILSLAGAELLVLSASLYYVNWKLQYRHVIRLTADLVRIDKGHYLPRRSWSFLRADTRLAVTPEKHPWEGPTLAVHSCEDRVPIGEFLNRDDALALLNLLRSELRVGTYSSVAERKM